MEKKIGKILTATFYFLLAGGSVLIFINALKNGEDNILHILLIAFFICAGFCSLVERKEKPPIVKTKNNDIEGVSTEKLDLVTNNFLHDINSDFHHHPGQFARFQRACNPSYTGSIISFDTDNICCEMKSSRNTDRIYSVSLSSCTCKDFTERRLPCKHMYKLAIALNIINENWDNFNIPSYLRVIIDSMSPSDLTNFYYILYDNNESGIFEVKRQKVPVICIEKGIFLETTTKEHFRQELDFSYTKNDIIATLATSNSTYTPNSKSTKREMIKWIVDNDEKLLKRLRKKHYYIYYSPDVYRYREPILKQYEALVSE